MGSARSDLRDHHRRTQSGRGPVEREAISRDPPRVQAVNPIGSGDTLLAGLVNGWLKRLDPEPLIRHALACAVANALVWDAGAIDPAEVARRSEEILVESLPRGT